MSIELTVGGWFASAFLDTLVEKASLHTLQQLGQGSDLHGEVCLLHSSLLNARVFLRIAERKQELLRELLLQLKDAAYDAEDLLGDLDYVVLCRKIAEKNEASHDVLSSSNSFAAKFFSPGDDDFAAKVRGVRERLDAVSNDIRNVIVVLNLEDGGKHHEMLAQKRESSSLPTEPRMIGRDKEKEALIQLLLSTPDKPGSSTADRNFSVLPIVGIGGVGKTTLAQFVYQDQRVQDNFELKMWVCVSNQPFDVKQLTREILESLGYRTKYEQSSLSTLQYHLKEILSLRRYLLVLDDVWNEDGREWERLYAPLKYGPQGSMIMVTTRSETVVREMRGALKPIFLEGLPEDDCREFFKTCAFGSENPNDRPEMEEIAERIAAKLKGSPFAAKILGRSLNSNMDVRHWRNIMYSEIWQLQQYENDIMPVLRLSYQHLPLHLKPCFSICSIYPQDYCFKETELVYLWMAQGFLVAPPNMRLEDVGIRYLHDLTSRSFFKKGHLGVDFQIHDWMHDLAKYVSKDECFSIQNDRQKIPSSIRHLSIQCTENLELHEVMDSDYNFNKLRSLVIFDYLKPEFNSAIVCWFDRLQYIRVLHLSSCYPIAELPKSIGNLKHLQFLKISYHYFSTLPESFCRLYNLKYLSIEEDCPLESFPRGFANLINLRRIDNENLDSKVTDIGKLTNLQYLDYFGVQKEHGHGIDELKNLKQLHGSLCIANLENVESREDACQANLDNKEYIDELTLEWSRDRNTCIAGSIGFSVDIEVLEGLKPHRYLGKLRIRCYGGDKLPSWLQTQTLTCLYSLSFVDCPNITDLPCISPFLKELEFIGLGLKSLPLLGGEGSVDQGIYARGSNSIRSSALSELHLKGCQNLTSLEEWLLPERLPSIKIIRIAYCKELVSLPVERFMNFISLKKLFIEYCRKLTSSKKLELNPSIEVLKLIACGELELSPSSCPQNLTSLIKLEISYSLHLKCLPRQLLHHMPALKNLQIISCPELRSIGGLDALTSLEYLTILECPKLTDLESLPSECGVQRKDQFISHWTIDKTVLLKQSFAQILPSFHLDLSIKFSEESVWFDEGDDQDWLQILTSLRKLEFDDCLNLRSLPTWLSRLTSLQYISVRYCPAIESLPENGLLISLREADFAAKVRGDRERPNAVSNEMRDVINVQNLEDGGRQHEMLAWKRESSSLPTDVKSVSPAEEKGNQKEKREKSKAEPNKGKAKKKGSKKKDELNTRFEDEKALSAPSISRCLVILDALADMVGSYYLQHGQLSDLLDILRQLGISLRKARAVLRFAKQQQAKDKGLLAQLKTAVLHSEDLLDQLDYQVLQVGDKAGNLPFQLSTVSFDADPNKFISEMMTFGKRLATISDEMREIIKLLEDDLPERQNEILSVEGGTIFSSIKPQVFVNEEKESLIQVLLRSADGSGSTKSNFSVLSIVGSKGVGKTALAKLVYHDQRVQKHFELKIWVCASESFDAKQLIEEIIIESGTAEKQSILTDLDSLQLILMEKVMSRRFVLVLDDVQIKDSSEWQKLYVPLNHGLQGSMILVTARSLQIANQLDTSYPIFLAGLTDDVISQASDLMKSEVRPELEDIGKRVAAKLEGSPLAAKLIGGLLNSKMDPGHWRKIDNHIRPLSRWGYDIRPVLQLCHRYLPARLRRCFSFCSIFPKDYIFRQDDLVFSWMALGFVAPQGNMRMEDVATTYFQDLTSRSFFEQSQLNHQYFVIHGVMHDRAESVSKNKCVRIEDGEFQQSIPSTVRHLSICTKNLEQGKLASLGSYNKLLSLTIMKNIELDLRSVINCWFQQLTSIQLLDLNTCEIEELPDSIGNLKQLRYLDISYTGIGRLPESFCCLHNMQFLFIKGCSFEGFPEGFTNLINLRYIDIESNMFSAINEIGRLTSLQELPWFEVLKENGHGIGELKDLTLLHRSLTVKNLENVESVEDANKARLDNKEYLNELVLEWSLSTNASSRCNYDLDKEVLEALRPHSKLKELEIRYYRGKLAPSWLCTLKLPCLVKLAIQHCPNLLNLSCLPPSLRVLELVNVGLRSLHILWDEGSTDKCISEQQCNKVIMSSLSMLSIRRCQKLKSLAQLLPHNLPVVKSICIEHCRELVSLPVESFGSFVFLEFLDITDCPNLHCPSEMVLPSSIKRLTLDSCGDLDKSLPDSLRCLTCLMYLNIYRCPHIGSLTGEVFHHLRALKCLYISECPKLRSLSGLEVLTSLQELTILKCPHLAELESFSDTEEQQKGMPPLTLTIDNTALLQLPSLRNLFSSSLNLAIWDSCESVMFVGEDEEWLQILKTLRELSFESCANLESLPSWFRSLTSLEKLRMCNCPQINSPPKKNLPTSLTDLYFDD